ncbi:hypothetical protein [Micromonospora sp. RTGN7]|uniref:hypothetical protein n=1 Tax=Micromonospora sp. RTGN7 TaxID=3016526 RepID=UPI0029FF2232|nr:hypothetical protein [Micromonospora sp. RTGN7]
MSPHRRPVPVWYALVAALVSALAVAGACIAYTEHVSRRQCTVLRTEVAAYREVPPTTPTGELLARAKEQLLRDLHC